MQFRLKLLQRKMFSMSSSFLPPHHDQTCIKRSSNLKLTNFIKIFFDFTYYLGTSPFRFTEEQLDGKDAIAFHIFHWKPQKVLCGILNVLCCIRLITEFRLKSVQTGSYSDNPILYFQMMLRMFGFTYKLLTLKRFCCNQVDFLQVLIGVQNDTMLPKPKMPIQNALVIKLFFGMCAGVGFADLISGTYFVGPTWRLSPSWWCRQLVSLARYTMFMGPEPSLNFAPELSEIGWIDVFFSILTGCGLFQRYILGLFCDLCILSHVITLWVVAYSFAQSISDPRKSETSVLRLPDKWDTVYRQYKAIRKLSQTINQALGNLVTCFMAEAIIFYSINLDVTLVTQDVIRKGHMVYFYFDTFSILFISADICGHLDSLKTWLADDENRKNVPLDELQIVLQELQSKDVGIRGSNVFTLTYSLVASYCTLIVTYFIISVQHRSQLPQTPMDA